MLSTNEAELLARVEGPLVAADARGTIEFASPDAERALAIAPGSIVGHPLTVLMPARMRARHLAGFRRYQESGRSKLLGKPVRVPAVRGDGREVEIDLRIRIFRRPDGTDLILATFQVVEPFSTPPPDLVELETTLERRAYSLI